jgi:hypothetical protein
MNIPSSSVRPSLLSKINYQSYVHISIYCNISDTLARQSISSWFLRPTIHISFFPMERYNILFHAAFHLSNFQYIFVRLASKTYQSLIYCHSHTILHKISHHSKLSCRSHASCCSTNPLRRFYQQWPNNKCLRQNISTFAMESFV